MGTGDAALRDGFLTGFTSPHSLADAKSAVVSDGGSTTDMAWARWGDGPITFNGGSRLIPANTRSEEHTSELQSLMRISYAVFCMKKKKNKYTIKDIFI